MTGFRSTSIVIEIVQRLLVILSILGLLLWIGVNTEAVKMVCELNARGATAMMCWTGLDAVNSGNLIGINPYNLRVGSECSAVLTIGSLAVLMSIVPVSFSRISSGIFLGTLLIILGNVMRIAFLGHLVARFPSAFEMWHLSILPVLQVILTFGIWWAWFQHSTKNHPRFSPREE